VTLVLTFGPKKKTNGTTNNPPTGAKAPKENTMELTYNESWQTQARGTNDSEYQIYLSCAGDSDGNDTFTGRPLKTYDEWLNS